MKQELKINKADYIILLRRYSNHEQYFNFLKSKLIDENLWAFFAQPDVSRSKNSIFWTLGIELNYKDIIKYSNLSEEQKDIVAIEIQQKRKQITEILKAAGLKEGEINNLFYSPFDLRIFLTEEGRLFPVIYAWGLKKGIGKQISSLSEIWNREIRKFGQVFINVKYNDNTIAPKETIFYQYKKIEKSFKTNLKGSHYLGFFEIGSDIKLIYKHNDNPVVSQIYQVNNRKENFEFIIPKFSNAKLLVKDQIDKPVENYPIKVIYKEKSEVYNTNQKGEINLSDLIVTEKIVFIDSRNENNFIEGVIKDDEKENLWILKIILPVKAQITVLDQNEKIVPNYKLIIETNEQSQELITNEQGIIVIYDLIPDENIVVIDSGDLNNKKSFIVNKNDNNWIFNVILPVEATIKVIDQKERPVANKVLIIEYNTTIKEYETDENGMIFLGKVAPDTIIKAIEKDNPENKNEYVVKEDEHNFIFHVEVPLEAELLVKVIDSENNILVKFPVIFKYKDQEKKYLTDEQGIIKIDNLIAGEKVKVYSYEYPDQAIEKVLEEGINNITLVVEKKYIQIIIHRKVRKDDYVPLINHKIAIVYKDKQVERITNNEGKVLIAVDELPNKNKVKVKIFIVRTKKNGEKKVKVLTKRIKLNLENDTK